MVREVELKWKLESPEQFQAALFRLAIPTPLLRSLKKAMPHLRALSASEVRKRFGPTILGHRSPMFERNVRYRTPQGRNGRLRMIARHRGAHGNAHPTFSFSIQ